MFIHDLKLFFFSIYVRCDGPGEGRVVARFDKRNYPDTEELAQLKKGQVFGEEIHAVLPTDGTLGQQVAESCISKRQEVGKGG